jgi:hypothetical protein
MTGQQADIKKHVCLEQMSRMIKQPILFPSENCYSVDDGNDSVLEVVFYIYILFFRDGGNIWESMVDGRCGGINGDGYYCDSIAATVTAML